LTGELPQFFGSAAFISLDDKERGMKEEHQFPSLPCLAVSGRHDFSHLSSHDRSIAIQDLHKASGHCISFRAGHTGVLVFDRSPSLIGSATVPEGPITQV
jgi:hypothetical protein